MTTASKAGFLIAALFLENSALAQVSPPPIAAKKLYGQQCAACHSLATGEIRAGPSLAGVMGRRAGKAKGFLYSPALKASRLTWDEASLDRWLADSRATIPGTKMPYRLSDPQKRQLIIAFIKNEGK